MYRVFSIFLVGILSAKLLLEYMATPQFPLQYLVYGILVILLMEQLPRALKIKSPVQSLSFYLCFFALGFYSFQRSVPEALADDRDEALRLFKVEEILKQKEGALQLALRFSEGNDSLGMLADKLFWTHLRIDSCTIAPRQGQLIWLRAKISKLPVVSNPGAFDFGAYLLQKGFAGQIFLRKGDWGLIDAEAQEASAIKRWRNYLLKEIESWHWQEENEAVFKALTLGYKNELSKELKADFAAAGAMHLLAVSGLHVGIVYLLLSYLLVALRYFKELQLVRSLVLIGGIWLYALMSGASPSVLRSATMFSIMAAVQNLERPGTSFRALFLSAFVLLIFNAAWLFDLGFQLSYSALLGILIWQAKIESLFETRFKPLIWLNKLLSVSLAAQIGTLPLTLYFFHQFPTYFWLSNIVMIPLVTVLMYAGFLLLLIGQAALLPGLYEFLEKLLSTLIYLNEKIADLPLALVRDIPFDRVQAAILGALVIALSVFLLHKRKLALYAALLTLFLWGSFQLGTRYLRIQSAAVQVYESRSFVASLREGENFYVYAKDSSQYAYYRKYLWRDHMLALGLNPEEMQFFDTISELKFRRNLD
mgnify:CR=1 FL=1|tara:strand:- start:2282 stop:4057 length:1776 start_codon:yes stop_codon:yes gene_type:complete